MLGRTEREREREAFSILKDFRIVLNSMESFIYGPNIIYSCVKWGFGPKILHRGQGYTATLTGKGCQVRLYVNLLQQNSSGQVDGEVAPGLFRKEDVGPSSRTGSSMWGRGLQKYFRWLCRGTAGVDGACKGTAETMN